MSKRTDAIEAAATAAHRWLYAACHTTGEVNWRGILDDFVDPLGAALAIPKDDTPSAPMFAICAFRNLWNLNCGTLPKCHALNASRIGHIRAALKEEPDLEVWAKVIRMKSTDDFWLAKGYGIDTLLRADRRLGYVEQALAGVIMRKALPQGFSSWDAFYQHEARSTGRSYEEIQAEHEGA